MVFKKKLILILLLIIGTVFQVLPVIRSGLTYSYGVGFWGPNGHDGIWHLSLINHIDNPLKINMPTFSGEYLINYHPFFDIIISVLSQLTHIPSSLWLFQIFPVISAFTLLYLSFKLGSQLTDSFYGGITLLVLNFTANSLGWLISLLKTGTLGGESIFWAMQSPSNQVNPPYNLSLIFLLGIFLVLINHGPKMKLSLNKSLLIFTLLSILPITKAYSAITGFGIFTLFSIFSYIKFKNKSNLILLFFSLVVSFTLFGIYNSKSTGLFVYKPFWFINSMIESPDRVYIPILANMRYALESSGKIGPRLIILWIFTFLIFIIGNFGTRLLGFIPTRKKSNYIYITLTLLIIVQILIPTFFIQKGTSWNTIQFIYYSLFLTNILLTLFLSSLNKSKQYIYSIIIIFTNILGLIGMLPNYLGQIPPSHIPKSEIIALRFLYNLPKGNVLTVPYNKYVKQNLSAPIPLYAYETTAYVSAYSGKQTYVDDEMNLGNSNFNYQPRLDQSQKFFEQKNIFQDRGFLLNNNISYIYIPNKSLLKANLEKPELYLKKLYDDQDILIYQVLK